MRPVRKRAQDQGARDAVLHRLAMLDRMAEAGAAESLLPLARTELQRLTEGWRLLLTVHQPGPDQRCRACPKAFWSPFPRRWPCRIWVLAYQQLVGDSLPRLHRWPLSLLSRMFRSHRPRPLERAA